MVSERGGAQTMDVEKAAAVAFVGLWGMLWVSAGTRLQEDA